MASTRYEEHTSFDVFCSLFNLSEFKGCMPKPILKAKPQDPLVQGTEVEVSYMRWTETLVVVEDAVYLPCKWKTRSTVILKLLICALTHDMSVKRVGVLTKKNSAVDELIWSDDARQEFMKRMAKEWFEWIRRLPSESVFDKILSLGIGHHTPFRKTLSASLEGLPNDRPYQVFMHSKDEPTPYTIYIHSPYTINLDNPESIPRLKHQLEIADSIGAKGVVVHCAKGASPDNMFENLKSLDMTEYKTDLLVETSAGQGTEVLSNPADLRDFIDKLDNKQIKVCLDTCHVFSAGYDPVEALKILKGKVALVHYNNSRARFGSKVDRHQYIVGHIDARTMYKIAIICTKLGIPMVIE